MNETLKRSIIPIAKQIETCVGAIEQVVENVPDEGAFYLTDPRNVVENRAWLIRKCATKMLMQLFKESPRSKGEDIDSEQIASAYVSDTINQIIVNLFDIEKAMGVWVTDGMHDCWEEVMENAIKELSLMTDALVKAVCANVLGRKI